jgi:tRNA pseudouridine55 synthase
MNGIIVVDKPGGMTSHDVVDSIRRIVGIRRVGHAGTLDPHATGILIMLLGKATKVSRFLMGLEKEYVFTIQLGLETDTLDCWGKTVGTSSPDGVSREDILDAASQFVGEHDQVAPSVSALKHKGVRLYKLARRGEPVPAKTRPVRVDVFEVTGVEHPFVTIRTVCSSGTYVRSLARDMGHVLGCGACVSSLRRLRVGDFGIEGSVRLEDLEHASGDPAGLREVLLSIEEGLIHLPKIRIGPEAVQTLRAGGQTPEAGIAASELDFEGDYAAITDDAGRIIAIARRSDMPGRRLRTERIL